MENPIQKLKDFVGVWECAETYHAGGWTPTDVKSTFAEDNIRFGPGGSTLIADYQSDSAFGHYEAHDVIIWDDAAQAYKFFFFDSFSPGYQVQTGQIEGNVVTFTSTEQQNGQSGTLRRTYTLGDNSAELVVDFTDESGNQTKLATITKRRKS